MIWKIINKEAGWQPTTGTYRDWKPQLAEEGHNQCVYCAIHENSMGGIRNFHVEHYRPKSKFPELINNYSNLFYACPVCNTYKSNDWPNEPVDDNSIASYPNPSEIDYCELFTNDTKQGIVEGNNIAAKYMQEKIFLNRPQLIHARRIHNILGRGKEEIEKTKNLLGKIKDDKDYRRFSEKLMCLWSRFDDLQDTLRKIPHYSADDIRRN